MRTSIATLVMLIGAGLSAPAMATTSVLDHDQDTRGVIVRYGDLNVDTARGAEQLYSRISHAAHRVCSDDRDPLYRAMGHAYQRCQQTALVQAVATVDRPKLTALYDRHFPRSPLANASAGVDRGSRTVG